MITFSWVQEKKELILNLKTGFTFLCMRRRHKAEAVRYALWPFGLLE